jgi:1,4-dihydroxy-2-naphthoate octaprenyltransferase
MFALMHRHALSPNVMPAILLAGCPDRDADQAVGKRTLVVILGKRGAVRLAMIATLAAPTLAALFSLARFDIASLLLWTVGGGSVHAAWLLLRLHRLTSGEIPERIDGTIALALTFILWFCVPPLIALARGPGSVAGP